MEKCAVYLCKQVPQSKCKRCGELLCYDHLVSHSLRKRDHGEYHQEHKKQCVTCKAPFTRVYLAPPLDEAEAKQRAYDVEHKNQCPYCSRFRPVA